MLLLLFFYLSMFDRIKQMIRIRQAEDLGMIQLKNIKAPDIHNHNKLGVNELKSALSFAKGLFVMYFMYALTALPLCIIVVIDMDQIMPAYVHMYPWLFFRLCAAATPVVYPLFHASICRGYEDIFSLVFMCKKAKKKLPGQMVVRKKVRDRK